MKLKPEQVGAKLDRPGPDLRLYLFHGPDTAGAMALAARLAKGVGEGAERVDMDGAMLKARPGLLADEAASMSLFGDKRHIRVTGMGEESVEAVTLLLNAASAGNPVAAIAPTAKATSKLVKLVTASLNAVAVACYVPDAAQAAKLAVALAREQGVRLLGDVPERLAAVTMGDRAVLASEIEKLALYLDAAPDRPRDADAEVFDAIGASIADAEANNVVAAMIAGNAAAAALPEPPGGGAIPLLRAVARRLLSLAEMRADIDDGQPVDQVLERHRVFFKEQATTRDALRRWDAPRLARAVERVRDAERAALSGSGLGEVMTAAEAIAIARAAGRGR
ncbi:DNA polymerase III subunit delta [Sphingomonas sp. Leaf25]|uniref:DNA polymerase III subunit delta n=1 Tax=Sphingomonas sp. Leaf25 TaxID=1735692 RepID=UPI0007001D70|nr:DNA polymerase III subunit delta [Sphingomonas sp. Leaf25]KQN00225.1 DNA polymerase III subunit delta [Sphingomonas sp. Leaf25]